MLTAQPWIIPLLYRCIESIQLYVNTPGGISNDDFQRLANLNLDAIAQDDVDAINRYGDLWLTSLAPNQAIRMDGKTRIADLGQDRYGGAKAAWFAIR
jgi:hypothetical protein